VFLQASNMSTGASLTAPIVGQSADASLFRGPHRSEAVGSVIAIPPASVEVVSEALTPL
jgi:hypothetical protein